MEANKPLTNSFNEKVDLLLVKEQLEDTSCRRAPFVCPNFNNQHIMFPFDLKECILQ